MIVFFLFSSMKNIFLSFPSKLLVCLILYTKEMVKFSSPVDGRQWGRLAEMLEPGKAREMLIVLSLAHLQSRVSAFFSRRVWKVSVASGSYQKQVR